MKTYEVPFQGRVDHTEVVVANSPSEAIEIARAKRNATNLKSAIYVNFWFDDEFEDDVIELEEGDDEIVQVTDVETGEEV